MSELATTAVRGNEPEVFADRAGIPVRVLCLDDDPEGLKAVMAALRRGRIEPSVTVTADPVEFRRLLESRAFDVVLAAHELPGWDALEALEIIRDGEFGVPLVIVTEYAGEERAAAALNHGAAGLVYKDRLAALPTVVERVIEERLLRGSQVQAELALRSANQVLTALIRCAPLPITVTDQHGVVNVWNPASEEILGWSKEEVLGNPLCGVVGNSGGLAQVLRRAARDGGVMGAEIRQRRKDGAEIDLRVFCAPLTDLDGRPQGVMAMLTDVTERNLIIEAFRQSKERFQSAFVHAPIGMAIASLDGRILRVNAAFCRMLGYQEAELLRLRWSDLILEEDRAKLAGAAGAAVVQLELRLRHRGGAIVHVQWNTSLVGDASGAPQYQIGQVVDISESKRAAEAVRHYAEELERSNSDLQHFAYVASHDLQEPLRMVRGFVELLAKRYHGRLGEDADEYIRFAVDGAKRMQNLIRGLLAYSRVGTQGKDFEPVDLEEAMRHALLNLQLAIEECGARVTHDPLPVAPGDDMQIVQLFQNLIGNAIKFRSADSPRIHIGVADKKDLWEVSVRDNGIGFDQDHANRIFQMFQRLHGQAKYEGTGIGLALCKRIVERHGGEIRAASAPGQGSTFCFTLPKLAPEQGTHE